jgi:peptidoglycan/xylan/chitin deacetylase (PgdA/CDA1 family)
MRYAVFSVDVDRDVNVAEQGRYDAASTVRGKERSSFRTTSSARGLQLIVDLLADLDIKATFFLEGDTLRAIAKKVDVSELLSGHEVGCHGVCHEDITGESTGICLTGPEIEGVVSESASIVKDVVGRQPTGFRAPYLHTSSETLSILADEGFKYDSSKTIDVAHGRIGAYRLDEGLWELPVARGMDAKGKPIHSYFWPMHEGKREVKDYLDMAFGIKVGCLVLATHSWHMVETYGSGVLDEDRVSENLRHVRQVLEGIRDMGFEFRTAAEAVDLVAGDSSYVRPEG